MKKFLKRMALYIPLSVGLFLSNCASPVLTGILLTNNTPHPLRVDVFFPLNTPPDPRTVYSGGSRLVTHQKVSSTWFGCKADLADLAMTIHFGNGVSIAYNREEILRNILWDSKECVWKMDVSIAPMSSSPTLEASSVGMPSSPSWVDAHQRQIEPPPSSFVRPDEKRTGPPLNQQSMGVQHPQSPLMYQPVPGQPGHVPLDGSSS